MLIPQDKYYNHQELTDILNSLEASFPDLIKVQCIGRSIEKREIWAATITDSRYGSHDSKPALFVDACVHAGEVTGTQTCLYLMDYLLSNYENDKEINRLLKKRTIYIIPRVNPDGAERFITTSFESWGNLNPFPEKKNWVGLERCDIDNNGIQLLMRIKDKNGEWKISSKDQRLMIPRKPYEFDGEYYRLYPEGMLTGEGVNWNDFRVLPKEFQLNMNRNYADGWNIKTSVSEGGKYPFSEPEVFAVATFIMNHPNIGIGNDFHTYGGVLLRPYSYQSDKHFPQGDLELYNAVGAVGKEITGYDLVSAYEGFSEGLTDPRRGCIDDWAYEALGVLMISSELWNMAEMAGVHRQEGNYYPFQLKDEADELIMLEWNDKNLDGKGFVNWSKYQHPQLGEVEIGGWNWKFTSKNPPTKFLEGECRKNALHCVKQANLLPEIEVKCHQVEVLEKDIYRVSITIENAGFLPTNITEKSIQNKLAKEVEITLINDKDFVLISGSKVQTAGHMAGRFRKESNFYFGDPTEDIPRKTSTVSWVLRAKEPHSKLSCSIKSEKGGSFCYEISLI